MVLKFVDEGNLKGQKIIARFDFNVPLDQNGNITDTTRIDNALETIEYLLSQEIKKLVIISHLGRPKGKVKKELSLAPVADYLAEKLKENVILTESCLDRSIKTLLMINKARVILLENVRFHSGETDNNRDFTRKLGEYGDVYVNDAFGTSHRKHASTYGLNSYFKGKSFAGFLLKKEN